MTQLTMYHREGCGLCEQMLAELFALQSRYTFALDVVDIDEDPDLRERFNTKVPVLAVDGDILCCHFLDREALLDLLGPA
ncbi:glutaredoxin family protein [Thioalkalivibrio sp. ALJ24]|uniref:glutaredoxin family protein n=1 Tax=Thioalkalivibrio sp. ALJ24 TaxID=545276 RepID=UPI00047561B0|nr:glutaredoxin family protein [Thioalkalivibrio sp. ALJ24]